MWIVVQPGAPPAEGAVGDDVVATMRHQHEVVWDRLAVIAVDVVNGRRGAGPREKSIDVGSHP